MLRAEIGIFAVVSVCHLGAKLFCDSVTDEIRNRAVSIVDCITHKNRNVAVKIID